jgi:hypothetical protein
MMRGMGHPRPIFHARVDGEVGEGLAVAVEPTGRLGVAIVLSGRTHSITLNREDALLLADAIRRAFGPVSPLSRVVRGDRG